MSKRSNAGDRGRVWRRASAAAALGLVVLTTAAPAEAAGTTKGGSLNGGSLNGGSLNSGTR